MHVDRNEGQTRHIDIEVEVHGLGVEIEFSRAIHLHAVAFELEVLGTQHAGSNCPGSAALPENRGLALGLPLLVDALEAPLARSEVRGAVEAAGQLIRTRHAARDVGGERGLSRDDRCGAEGAHDVAQGEFAHGHLSSEGESFIEDGVPVEGKGAAVEAAREARDGEPAVREVQGALQVADDDFAEHGAARRERAFRREVLHGAEVPAFLASARDICF